MCVGGRQRPSTDVVVRRRTAMRHVDVRRRAVSERASDVQQLVDRYQPVTTKPNHYQIDCMIERVKNKITFMIVFS